VTVYAPHTLRETCHCGHHKDTHFAEPNGKRGACLGMRCDDCHEYADDTGPKPAPRVRVPDPPPTDPDLDAFTLAGFSPPKTPNPYYPWAYP
jgi:hypothetical protein